ncbi:MAG: hypothetical protein EXS36_11100 [Pedosphaera sp.]|nr:hypothetical protein [Pedosphaera sp.]
MNWAFRDAGNVSTVRGVICHPDLKAFCLHTILVLGCLHSALANAAEKRTVWLVQLEGDSTATTVLAARKSGARLLDARWRGKPERLQLHGNTPRSPGRLKDWGGVSPNGTQNC